jgi:lycopene cyclase CruP
LENQPIPPLASEILASEISASEILAKIPGATTDLARAEAVWSTLRAGPAGAIAPVMTQNNHPLASAPEWDVVICGGTLGIFLGLTLVKRGWKVLLLERGQIQGRRQEWNISRAELEVLVRLDLLSLQELEAVIATEFNPVRIQFEGGDPVWVENVLNLGVSPLRLLALLKQKFLQAGGTIQEHTAFEGIEIHPNGVEIATSQGPLRSRLMLDAMGHGSPLVRQARAQERPDAVCLVVGTCATGFEGAEGASTQGDLIVSFTPIQNQCQYFWEAFPAEDGRTTYLFTYLDTHPDRISLTQLFEAYCQLLPQYQGTPLQHLTFQRALFGVFPSYRRSPLPPLGDRILPVGDSSGAQSPLSFGGFGAMLRHLERLSFGLDEALAADLLDRQALGWLQPYQPNLSVTWLFQRSMSVGINQTLGPDQINQTLSGVFAQMSALGEPTLKPFLQDVVQFPGLFQTLLRTGLLRPWLVLKILPQVGLGSLVTWLGHYAALAGYSLLARAPGFANNRGQSPALQSGQSIRFHGRFYWRRFQDALHYGSGRDYHDC